MLNMLDAGLHKTHEWAPIHKTYRTRQGHYVAHYLVGDSLISHPYIFQTG